MTKEQIKQLTADLVAAQYPNEIRIAAYNLDKALAEGWPDVYEANSGRLLKTAKQVLATNNQ